MHHCIFIMFTCMARKTAFTGLSALSHAIAFIVFAADRFLPADDTLVISGGLYDGPRVYNPTMTTANEAEDYDQPPFGPRPTQFQLALLKDSGEKPTGYEASTFQRF
ncbi:hypothetical protein AAFF_G00313860 [Aldrovandia affinis]|uniref:Uncharacterized protein n=1 Tax=Aldrovandia affinis TaxID=143900 RepID=A0AAD7W0G4_9TELE|nr:hypothetical protein AAFF_G00313860 [Aldrovandia affinis]